MSEDEKKLAGAHALLQETHYVLEKIAHLTANRQHIETTLDIIQEYTNTLKQRVYKGLESIEP